ncbi:hypothetical protein AMJ86_04830 [bacterium SM23_57]|nr:MAG: hypothetical protein AMJ86_04830 [bacterium SM23_57]
MNEDGDYPQNDSLPILYELNWMQYILDNYSTVEEAIRCAYEIEVEGPGKHFFVGDAQGNCAAIAFIDSQIVVNRDQIMPVPGLFNTPYNRELELLKYYKGFGGLYEPDLSDPRVPRFVKTAVMIRDYEPTQDIVNYGFEMLDTLKVWDVPEWSILFDVRKRNVYFKTRVNPEIKNISMDEIDFSNNIPVMILNMDIEEGRDVLNQFHPYTNEKMRDFTEKSMFPILPEEAFTLGEITLDEYLERTSTHNDAAALTEKQCFKGVWKNNPDKEADEMEIILKLETKDDAVFGQISLSVDAGKSFEIEHIHLIGNNLKFTFETSWKRNKFFEIEARINNNEKTATLYGIEDNFGSYLLFKDNQL